MILTALLSLLAYHLPNARQQLDPANPGEDLQRQRHLRIQLSNLVLCIAFVVNLSMLVGTLPTWGIYNTKNAITIVIIFASLLPFFVIALIVTLTMKATRRYSESTGISNVTRVQRDDDRYWLAGLFYYNPNDPSILVEKRFGIGWTLNMGNPLSIFLSIAVAIIIVLIAVLSMLSGHPLK